MSGYTPGPWDFGQGYMPGDSTFDLFGRGGRQVIAQASYENMWLSTYEKEVDAANARLIAAAPELLDALIEMVDAADDEGQSERPMVVMARSAIRKATEAAS